jgi:hypothetical protein
MNHSDRQVISSIIHIVQTVIRYFEILAVDHVVKTSIMLVISAFFCSHSIAQRYNVVSLERNLYYY